MWRKFVRHCFSTNTMLNKERINGARTATFCPQPDDDEKSRASQAKSVKKLTTQVKSLQKGFAQLKSMKEDADSDLSDSDDEEEASHFQFNETNDDGSRNGFQFTQVTDVFEPCIAELFNQSREGTKVKLDLTQVILLDSGSTMDLFCNSDLVASTYKAKSNMTLRSNGGSMRVNREATLAGYHKPVWFDKTAITNIISLKNVIKQYRVTYDSLELQFVTLDFLFRELGIHVSALRRPSAKAQVREMILEDNKSPEKPDVTTP